MTALALPGLLAQGRIEPTKGFLAAGANFKIGSPAAILPHHRRPDPQILPFATPPGVI